MSIKLNARGFTLVEVLIIIAVVGVLGFVGYNVFQIQNSKKASNSSSQQSENSSPTANDVSDAPEIKSQEDLAKAEKSLDETNVDSEKDSSELDYHLESF